MEGQDTSVEVLYDFEYPTKDGQKVSIKEGERLYLIKKTNSDWWQVIRSTGRRPFFVPSSYVKELGSKARTNSSSSSTTSTSSTCHIKTSAPNSNPDPKRVNNETQKESVKLNNDYKVTVSIKPDLKEPPANFSHQIIRSKSNTKVFLNCSNEENKMKNSNVNSTESLSEHGGDKSATEDRERGTVVVLSSPSKSESSGYSKVQKVQSKSNSWSKLSGSHNALKESTRAEANFLDENMTESLCELAERIQFVPKSMLDSGKRMSHSDSSLFSCLGRAVKTSGSFKTKFERRRLNRSASESTSDIPLPIAKFKLRNYEGRKASSDDEEDFCYRQRVKPKRLIQKSESNPFLDQLELGIAFSNLRRNTTPKSWNDNGDPADECPSDPLVESTDSVFSEKSDGVSCPAGGSSSESVVEEKQPKLIPLPKPRKQKQEEVIYANCQELVKLRNCNHEDENDSGRSPDDHSSSKSTLERSESNKNSILPPGWSKQLDSDTQKMFFTHESSNDKWFSSSDAEGRTYYYQENSVESSWVLPDVPLSNSESQVQTNNNLPILTNSVAELSATFNRISSSNAFDHPPSRKGTARPFSVILPKREDEIIIRPWPSLNQGQMNVLHKGSLQYTKIQEGGKRIKKNWTHAFGVLTEIFLLIYKDSKASESLKSVPEITIDLNGAEIFSGQRVSTRKHVFVVKTLLGLHIAIQCENLNSVTHWSKEITNAISRLPKHRGNSHNAKLASIREGSDEPKKATSIGRSKSVMFKNKEGSMEDLGATPAERQIKIKERLKKFFHKRPPIDSLVKKGIWKDEPIFACLLEQACGNNVPKIPTFVVRCIQIIESSEENMKTDGLYRASGNLSQVQKIRLQIDQHNYSVLSKEEDVHVLTGALKLFFRELKEPLIPCKLFSKSIKASMTSNKKEKLHQLQDIIKALPAPHRDTLKLLLQHLLRVTQYQEHNRMRIANLAIVFGPTLMWPEHESSNMALDLLQQNMVIESLLNDFHLLFKEK